MGSTKCVISQKVTAPLGTALEPLLSAREPSHQSVIHNGPRRAHHLAAVVAAHRADPQAALLTWRLRHIHHHVDAGLHAGGGQAGVMHNDAAVSTQCQTRIRHRAAS